MTQQIEEQLKNVFGYDGLRPGQQPLIQALCQGNDVLGIMPTGAGKSLCFQLPALCMSGVTLVISPLISLMRDQVTNLVQQGVAAAFLNSSLTIGQYRKATENLRQGKYKIVYVAPERILTDRFLWAIEGLDIAIVAIDEAHCVSQWGQDFRPSYLQIKNFIHYLPKRPAVAAFTATATPQVHKDIRELLELSDPKTVVTGFDRPNLKLHVLKPEDKNQTLYNLIQKFSEQRGIVYCSTRKQVEQVQQFLLENGVDAVGYHGGMEDEIRYKAQEDFVFDRVQVMVATNAFGMGIDKPDVRFVIHYNMPLDLESYYQEAGRGGRDGQPAECILLYSPKDVRVAQFLIDKSFENHQESELYLKRRAEERLKQMVWYCNSRRCLRRGLLQYFGERYADNCGNCSVCLKQREEPNFLQSWKQKWKPFSDGKAPVDAELVEKLKKKRMDLAKRQGVPAFVVFNDSTLQQLALQKPTTLEEILKISGIGQEKAKRYGQDILKVMKEYQKRNHEEEKRDK